MTPKSLDAMGIMQWQEHVNCVAPL